MAGIGLSAEWEHYFSLMPWPVRITVVIQVLPTGGTGSAVNVVRVHLRLRVLTNRPPEIRFYKQHFPRRFFTLDL